jgi:amino acid transporter
MKLNKVILTTSQLKIRTQLENLRNRKRSLYITLIMYSRLTIWWIICLVLAIFFIVIFVIVFEVRYKGLINGTPGWIFIGFFLGIIFLVLAAILYVIERAPSWAPRGTIQPPSSTSKFSILNTSSGSNCFE